MTVVFGCIADDYTGASDLANALARTGFRVIQTIGVPDADTGPPLADVDAVVVALKSRSIAAVEAVSLSRGAAKWLSRQGAKHIMFKICSTFDSTDKGNIGPVTDALRTDAGDGAVIVTPAFPETGRAVFQGNLFVGSVPLNESPLKDHPLNPMRDANLVRVLGRQSQYPVGLIPFTIVERGAEAIAKAAAAHAKDGKGAVIVDAIADKHLQPIGEAALRNAISVGASGLGIGIARAMIAAKQVSVAQDVPGQQVPVGGKAAILAGSCSQATREQISAVEGTLPVLRLDVVRLLAGAPVAAEALDWAKDKLSSTPVLIASTALPEQVTALQAQHANENVGHLIEQALAEIGAGLVERGVRRLIVAGGETSGAVVDRLGIAAFLVGPEIAPGVPILRTIGREGDMLLALKSGNFGGRDFFERAMALMQ